MAIGNDPRPVLRQELSRVFQNQRVIRAFEKIFDLIPPQFINQQTQIDAINLVAEFANSQVTEAVSALVRLAAAIELLAEAPREITPVTDDNLSPVPVFEHSFLIGDGLIGLPPNSRPALDQSIAPTWTGQHTYNLPFITKGYTVGTLPAGTLGMVAHVTDAAAPAFLVAVVGGGAVKSLVFYNGAAWVAA